MTKTIDYGKYRKIYHILNVLGDYPQKIAATST